MSIQISDNVTFVDRVEGWLTASYYLDYQIEAEDVLVTVVNGSHTYVDSPAIVPISDLQLIFKDAQSRVAKGDTNAGS